MKTSKEIEIEELAKDISALRDAKKIGVCDMDLLRLKTKKLKKLKG